MIENRFIEYFEEVRLMLNLSTYAFCKLINIRYPHYKQFLNREILFSCKKLIDMIQRICDSLEWYQRENFKMMTLKLFEEVIAWG